MTTKLTNLPAADKALLSETIMKSIMAMEEYLISAGDRYTPKQMWSMTIGELWQRHSELVQQMDGLL